MFKLKADATKSDIDFVITTILENTNTLRGEGFHMLEKFWSQSNVERCLEYLRDASIDNPDYSLEEFGITVELHGKAVGYYANGQIARITNYKNGKLCGVSTEYYESGKLLMRGQYKNNRPYGKFKTYSEHGILIQEDLYKHGILKYALNVAKNEIFQPFTFMV